MPWNDHLAHAFLAEQRRHGVQRRRLAVNHESAADRATQAANPAAQLPPVGVGGIPADRSDLRPSLDLFAQYRHLDGPVLEATAQRVLGLKADEQHAVAM